MFWSWPLFEAVTFYRAGRWIAVPSHARIETRIWLTHARTRVCVGIYNFRRSYEYLRGIRCVCRSLWLICYDVVQMYILIYAYTSIAFVHRLCILYFFKQETLEVCMKTLWQKVAGRTSSCRSSMPTAPRIPLAFQNRPLPM